MKIGVFLKTALLKTDIILRNSYCEVLFYRSCQLADVYLLKLNSNEFLLQLFGYFSEKLILYGIDPMENSVRDFQDAARIWKEQGSKPEQRAQFILKNILVSTFTLIYLILYKLSFFCFQQHLIFQLYRLIKHFLGILSDKRPSDTLYVDAWYSL